MPIQDGIDVFHLDALSSWVALKVHCEVQLPLLASGLYRMLANRIGNGTNWRKRSTCSGTSSVLPLLLLAAGYNGIDLRVPWLQHKRLQLVFG